MPPKKRAKPVTTHQLYLANNAQSKRASDDDDSEVASEGEAEPVEATVLINLYKFIVYVQAPGTEFREKDGTRGWELGNKRRLTVSTFKGKQYVGIREYYEKNGKVSIAVRLSF